jgi:hypothetical protein
MKIISRKRSFYNCILRGNLSLHPETLESSFSSIRSVLVKNNLALTQITDFVLAYIVSQYLKGVSWFAQSYMPLAPFAPQPHSLSRGAQRTVGFFSLQPIPHPGRDAPASLLHLPFNHDTRAHDGQRQAMESDFTRHFF